MADDKEQQQQTQETNEGSQSNPPDNHSPEAAQNGQPDSEGMSGGTSDGDDNSG